jgi:hypothetical protein
VSRLEERIRRIATPTDFERLDKGVGAIIIAARAEARGRRLQVPLWVAAAACLLFALAGGAITIWLHGDSDTDVAPTTVVLIEATPELKRWLAGSLQASPGRGEDRQYQSVETLYVAGHQEPPLADNGDL